MRHRSNLLLAIGALHAAFEPIHALDAVWRQEACPLECHDIYYLRLAILFVPSRLAKHVIGHRLMTIAQCHLDGGGYTLESCTCSKQGNGRTITLNKAMCTCS